MLISLLLCEQRAGSQSNQEKRTESDMRPFAAGVVSLNSDICPISLKPVPKDAGAAPASFGAGLSEIGQISEFSDTTPTANGLSDPAQNHHREYSIRYILTPRVLNIVHCH